MHSCIYEGTVRHQRIGSVKSQFKYSLFMLYLDLSEIDRVFSRRCLWSASRPAVARFRRTDHLGDPSTPLDECVRDLVEQSLGKRPTGPIRLLTHLRYFGYLMNPVSLFYCFDSENDALQAVVAEVSNTPWGERHCYVLSSESLMQEDSNAVGSQKQFIRTQHLKEFHVSPFMPMDMTYRWVIRAPNEQLEVQIENLQDSTRVHSAYLSLQRREISAVRLNWLLLKYPWMTMKVAAAIYWQAFRLWWKGFRFYPHPGRKVRTVRQGSELCQNNSPTATVSSINQFKKESS